MTSPGVNVPNGIAVVFSAASGVLGAPSGTTSSGMASTSFTPAATGVGTTLVKVWNAGMLDNIGSVLVRCAASTQTFASAGTTLTAQIKVQTGPWRTADSVMLYGSLVVDIDLSSVADHNGNGLDDVPFEIVAVTLDGTTALSQTPFTATVRDPLLAPFLHSTGVIEEDSNTHPGTLDVPPFEPSGTASALLNLFVKIVQTSGPPNVIVGAGPFHNDVPIAIRAHLTHVPWASTDTSSSGSGLYVGDLSNCRVRIVSGGTIGTVAGTGACAAAGADSGPAISANVRPSFLAFDGSDNLYIGNTSNCRVSEIHLGEISTVAGSGACGYAGDGDPATGAKLSMTTGVALDVAGNLFVADTDNCVVREVLKATGTIETIAGTGPAHCGDAGDGGWATDAQLNKPQGIAVDAAGNIYIADTDNCRIREVTGGTIITVAGNGICGYSGDGGAPASAGLDHPSGIMVDQHGALYIADSGNCRVRKVASGIILGFAGGGACGYAGDGGPATSASLDVPRDVSQDGDGTVYISDEVNCRIRGIASGIITTVAGDGTCGFGGDGGAATAAKLNHPTGVALNTWVAFAEETGGPIFAIEPGAIYMGTALRPGTLSVGGFAESIPAQIRDDDATARPSDGRGVPWAAIVAAAVALASLGSAITVLRRQRGWI